MKRVPIPTMLLASFIAMSFLSLSVKGQLPYELWIHATEGGTTDPEPGSYMIIEHGVPFEVRAIPAIGFRFDHWELDGVDKGAINPITVIMDDCHHLLAVFKPCAIGGTSVSIVGDRSGLLNPYLCLTSTIIIAAVLTSAYSNRVYRKSAREKN